MMDEKKEINYRSLFWPILLIGVGILWLLANLEILPDLNWWFFLRLWPLILVVIGLDIIIGRRTPIVGALLAIGTVSVLIILALLAPSLDFGPDAEIKTLTFSEPLENATSARINLELERYPTHVDSLSDSSLLIDADINTLTDVNFSSRGSKSKSINIEPAGDLTSIFDWSTLADRDAEWDIRISPYVPIDLEIDVGSGSANLDLSSLEMTDLLIDGGSGSTDVLVPASNSQYSVTINGGSGSFYIELENRTNIRTDIDIGSGSFDLVIGSGSDVEARIEGGSGSLDISVPGDVGVRVVIRDRGSGSVNLPISYDLIDDMDDNDRDTGIWETEGYSDAAHQIEITFDPGSGSFELR
jgi:hypothetical protein